MNPPHSEDGQILIENAVVVTMDPERRVLSGGWVAISGKRISGVGPVENASKIKARKVVDAHGDIILPGLVNGHTHLPMSLFRGLADDLDLHTWLNDHIFPAESRFIEPETARAGAMLACLEMLLSGTTCLCDGYFLEDEAAKAVEAFGMRGVMGQGVIDFPAPGVPDPAGNIKTAVDFVDRWKGRSERIRPSIFCHSPYTCSDATLKTAKKAAREAGVLFQIHVAETRSEVDASVKEHGISPVRRLERLGILGPGTLAVHTVWIDDDDIRILADTGTKVCHCPESNMKLGSGICPVVPLLKAKVDLALGTDGCSSNNDLDMFGEMDTAAKLQKAANLNPSVFPAAEVLAAATINGAKAIGLDEEIGSLEKGKSADLIRVSVKAPHMTPMYDPVSHLVYAARASDVDCVMSNGEWLVLDGRPVKMDTEKLLDQVRKIAARVRPASPS